MFRVCVFGLLLTGLTLWAGDGKDPMAHFKNMEGDWTIVADWKSPQEGWVTGKPTVSSFVPVFDGKAYTEKFTINLPMMEFHMQTTFSYDPIRKVYRSAAIDQASGMMDVMEGGFTSEKTLTLDNLRSKTYSVFRGSDAKVYYQVNFHFDDKDTVRKEVRVSRDEGKTWNDSTKVTYKRKS